MALDLPDGTSCFVDANIFYYHFVETPALSEPCSDFLQRVADGRVLAYTSTHALAEAVHKIMLAEAASTFGLDRTGLVKWLQGHRGRIAELPGFRVALAVLAGLPLAILPTDIAALSLAADCSPRLGLLTNDTITVALMRRQGLTELVTNDSDFEGVEGLRVWKPR